MPPRTLRGAWRSVRNRLWRRVELCVFELPADRVAALPNPRRLNRDAWGDLEKCRAWSYEHMSRDEYLAHVDERRRAGPHHLYSLVENGVLVHYGWITSRQERAPDAALGLVFVPPPGSAALWDYFTDPAARGRGLYADSLRQCLHDAVDIDGARHVFIYVYADNAASRRTIEKVGFDYRGSLVMERRLFVRRRYATSAGEALDVRRLEDDRPVPVRRPRRPAPAAPAAAASRAPSSALPDRGR